MGLEAGSTLGRYEIIEPAGAGGMGEVYRARDTRLDRTVAIKVLPPEVADDAQWQARFEREARAISKLAHPRICALYDIGHDEGVHYLVLEYLEGETLAARLARQPLSLAEALDYGEQIAEALAVAHRAGIVHRDLKPGNVFLTKAGTKLLDFGLAKPLVAPGTEHFTTAPTATSPLTAEGAIIGTFQYMAPEVLEGGEADARSDIFAFGAVLYEMVTGRAAFTGKSQASVVAAILKEEVRPLSDLEPATPAALDRLARQCLAKDPEDRWQSASDLAKELAWIATGEAPAVDAVGAAPVGAATARGSARLAWSVAGLATIVALVTGGLTLRGPGAPAGTGVVRFDIPPPAGTMMRTMREPAAPPEVSPDGRHVVFGLMEDAGNRLWIRSLDETEPRPLPGTEDGHRPFWSPDSRNVGFFTSSELRRVHIGGGPPLKICDVSFARGGTWNADDSIVFAPEASDALFAVPATGGEPRRITELSTSPAESSHRYPHFLPDGRHFLYLALSVTGATAIGPESEHRVMIGSLDGDAPRLLLRGVSNTVYAAGHLVFRRGQALQARPFDSERLEFTGEPRTVADTVHYDADYERAIFSAADGTLAYVGGDYSGETQLRLFDRSGEAVRELGVRARAHRPRFSPDGRYLAAGLAESGAQGIWILDLERDVRNRLTFEPGVQISAVWSPDGERIVYGSNTGAGWSTKIRSVDGAGEPRVVSEESFDAYPLEWSSDGRYLLLSRAPTQEGPNEIWMMDLEGSGELRDVLGGPGHQGLTAISPDGRWLAYSSTETGRVEVYLTRFPSIEGKWLVSDSGGLDPVWNVDGSSLFYRSTGSRLMEVPLALSGASPQIDSVRELFPLLSEVDIEDRVFDLSPDGQHFVATTIPEHHLRSPVTVVINWPDGEP